MLLRERLGRFRLDAVVRRFAGGVKELAEVVPRLLPALEADRDAHRRAELNDQSAFALLAGIVKALRIAGHDGCAYFGSKECEVLIEFRKELRSVHLQTPLKH